MARRYVVSYAKDALYRCADGADPSIAAMRGLVLESKRERWCTRTHILSPI